MHSIEASILVDVPADICYRHWMDFEKFPEFMRRVVAVKRVDSGELLPADQRFVSTEDPQKDYSGVITTEVIKEVAVHGNQIWHWEIKGPLGQLFEWTAGIVQNLPNKSVSWASTPEQELPNTGLVNFLAAPPDRHHHNQERTLITITMSFSAPLGVVGEFLSDMVHYGDNLLCEALQDFKTYVEQTYSVETGLLIPTHPHEKPMSSEAEIRQELGTNRS
jgi:uncharacterized membrane protein